jgi:hypothetical protein
LKKRTRTTKAGDIDGAPHPLHDLAHVAHSVISRARRNQGRLGICH